MNRSDRRVYHRLSEALRENRSVVLVTVVACDDRALLGTKQLIVAGEGNPPEGVGSLPKPWVEAVNVRAQELLSAPGKEITVERWERPGSARLAFEVFRPPPRLVIAGAGHIAQPAHEIAAEVGLTVAVLDDRPSFANKDRFPRATEIICDDFTNGIRKLCVDKNTSVVVVTRGHLHDLEVLRAISDTRPAYVGMIGSRRRVLTVIDKLQEDGVPEAFIDRLYTPIGLDIGAESPQEIALAIVAEVICVLRGGSGTHLRWRREKQRTM